MLQLGLLTTVLIVLLWAISLMVKGPWARVPALSDGRLLRRLAVGTVLVSALTAVLVLTSWTDELNNRFRIFVVGIAFVALLGGIVMRSWWSMLAIPVSITATLSLFLLRPEPECVNCRPQEVPDWTWVIAFAAVFSGPLALVAALGTFIPIWAPRA